MSSEMKTAIHQARELMGRCCSPAETEVLIRMAVDSPPRVGNTRATPIEAVRAMSLALTMNPAAKVGLLELADFSKEDRERVLELQAFERYRLPAFNAGYPHTGEELHAILSGCMRGMYPDVHESCINGALMVGVTEGPVILNGVAVRGWQMRPAQMIKTMRELDDADRSMRLGER